MHDVQAKAPLLEQMAQRAELQLPPQALDGSNLYFPFLHVSQVLSPFWQVLQ